MLNGRDFLRHTEARFNGRWYEPPVPMTALARSRHMSPHHSSALKYKVNQLARFFEPSRWLDRRNFGEFALNFLGMGNAYLERRNNLAGRPMALINSPAVNTRRGRDDEFFWIDGYRQETTFMPGSVFHLWEPDLAQELYGLPLNTFDPFFEHQKIDAGMGHAELFEDNAELFEVSDPQRLDRLVNRLHDLKHAFELQSLEIKSYYTKLEGKYFPRQPMLFSSL